MNKEYYLIVRVDRVNGDRRFYGGALGWTTERAFAYVYPNREQAQLAARGFKGAGLIVRTNKAYSSPLTFARKPR